jgi:hypothetical protein
MSRIKLVGRGALALAVMASVTLLGIPSALACAGGVAGGPAATQGSVGPPLRMILIVGVPVALAGMFDGVTMYLDRRRPAAGASSIQGDGSNPLSRVEKLAAASAAVSS